MKPTVALALARFYDTLPTGMFSSWRALLPAGVIIVMPALLVLMLAVLMMSRGPRGALIT